ncbi:MAG: Unknown protein, partial [uncultured Sulfurovum sp.]
AYIPQEDMDKMANEQSIYGLETMLKDMKENRDRLNK